MKRPTAVLRLIAEAWNWKSAVLSSAGRAMLFFATNLPAGLDAAMSAGQTEFIYRAIASGFYGALTERFARLRATNGSTAAALLVVPGLAHVIEYAVHRRAGTPNVGASVLVSIIISLLTTRLNLHAMRHGLLAAGRGANTSLASDLRKLTGMGRAWLLGDRAAKA